MLCRLRCCRRYNRLHLLSGKVQRYPTVIVFGTGNFSYRWIFVFLAIMYLWNWREKSRERRGEVNVRHLSRVRVLGGAIFVVLAYMVLPSEQYTKVALGCLLGLAAGILMGRAEVRFYVRAKQTSFPTRKRTVADELRLPLLIGVGVGLFTVLIVKFPFFESLARLFLPFLWGMLFSLQFAGGLIVWNWVSRLKDREGLGRYQP